MIRLSERYKSQKSLQVQIEAQTKVKGKRADHCKVWMVYCIVDRASYTYFGVSSSS